MAEEFTPDASVDFESLAAMAAAEASVNGNGDTPHFTPPPDSPPAAAQAPPIRPHTPPPTRAPHGGDPFAQLEAVARDLPLIYRELGDINAGIMRVQLTSLLAIGSALLLAVLVWKLSAATAAP